ncbi:hypothetical protein BKG89_04960 [Rodentibacter caecimuris]|uniref:DUF406 domain-containing protein n=2 Tax=Rodentibacter caecimuris TaxID=1796644 RepID=A0ABX3KYR0_9PAST|nr:hypothetical protein BKG89_04960 [Rodentibacter heylii]
MLMNSDKPIECVGCNTFDVKSHFDNSDCHFPIEWIYDTKQDAQAALDFFTEKAKEIESEPCQIQSEITQVENGYLLKADFTFCCQAEVVIFQMRIA